MQRKTYASDSDSGESQSIDAYDSAGGMAAATVDTLDTDSEDEQTARNDIMIIRDSSEEDNDFVSDPEDPLPYSRVAGRSGKSREKLDTFLSKFTPQRRRHVQQQKLNWRPGSAATKTHRTRTSPSRTTPKSVKGYSQELDDDIADFIVDDDAVECPAEVSASRHISASAYDSDASARPKFSRGGPDGVMALMPDEFSMFDLPTSFKAYIQYLVYWICNGRRKPVVSETNARYFFQAYIAVARVIDSVEQSVVASSAWVEPFRTSLYSYPDFAYSRISGIPGCDACHFHSNRTATFCVTLSGSPYKRTILAPPMPGEMVSEADDAEGEESDNVVTINDDSEDDSAKGKQAQPHFDYNLGKTCKLRSEICHELHHYLYHLANVVEIHLQTLELDSSQQSASGGGWEDVPPDDLVEMLDKRGQVDDLFQQFKELVSRSKSEFTS
ncbi:hypothetical protein EV174_000458 [Coemansia sp. RSA 2320]|nr:hypothetical protein EV174_000458 [Coemansia sp. RSA 2320]